MLIVTVSQVNRRVRAMLEEDKMLQDVFVKGEVSNFSEHYKSGHCYFSLKDAQSTIRAVMFRSDAELLRFQPQNGMAVIAWAHVGVYERDGVYQLYVTDLQPDGVGALTVAFEQTRDRLSQQGLFEQSHKKTLPALATRVGVVTSENAAALQDILHVLSRRFPLATVVLSPAQVQGEGAALSIIEALEALDKRGSCDVILLGRGGGSAEDLWCFNDERLARAIFLCRTPVISAVGHETDYTIADLVADVRAPTPSAAAELAVPSAAELLARLSRIEHQLGILVIDMISSRREAVGQLQKLYSAHRPDLRLTANKEKLDFLAESLYNSIRIIIQQNRMRLARQAELLDMLSPLQTLRRGYALVQKHNLPISDVTQLREGDLVSIRFWNGTAAATIERMGEQPYGGTHDI